MIKLLADQEELLPFDEAVPCGHREATRAAKLYRTVPRARGREVDLAVAACALVHEAALWTLNPPRLPRRSWPHASPGRKPLTPILATPP